jgi:hypothetical protein
VYEYRGASGPLQVHGKEGGKNQRNLGLRNSKQAKWEWIRRKRYEKRRRGKNTVRWRLAYHSSNFMWERRNSFSSQIGAARKKGQN